MGKLAGIVCLLLILLAPPSSSHASIEYPGFASSGEKPRAGVFLVASRKMRFTRFRETVIFLTRHDERGTVGVIINRPYVPADVSDPAIRLGRWPLYAGGPVEPNLYSILVESRNTFLNTPYSASNLMFFSGVGNAIRFTSMGGWHGKLRVYAGYAGWRPGQLMQEIRLGAWHVMPGDTRFIFDSHPSFLWQRLLRRVQMDR